MSRHRAPRRHAPWNRWDTACWAAVAAWAIARSTGAPQWLIIAIVAVGLLICWHTLTRPGSTR